MLSDPTWWQREVTPRNHWPHAFDRWYYQKRSRMLGRCRTAMFYSAPPLTRRNMALDGQCCSSDAASHIHVQTCDFGGKNCLLLCFQQHVHVTRESLATSLASPAPIFARRRLHMIISVNLQMYHRHAVIWPGYEAQFRSP